MISSHTIINTQKKRTMFVVAALDRGRAGEAARAARCGTLLIEEDKGGSEAPPFPRLGRGACAPL